MRQLQLTFTASSSPSMNAVYGIEVIGQVDPSGDKDGVWTGTRLVLALRNLCYTTVLHCIAPGLHGVLHCSLCINQHCEPRSALDQSISLFPALCPLQLLLVFLGLAVDCSSFCSGVLPCDSLQLVRRLAAAPSHRMPGDIARLAQRGREGTLPLADAGRRGPHRAMGFLQEGEDDLCNSTKGVTEPEAASQ